MGIDYPKIHNVAPLFVSLLKEKGIEVEKEVSDRILYISMLLAKDRAPAFYGERIFLKEDAERAQNGAIEVLEKINEIKNRLDKK